MRSLLPALLTLSFLAAPAQNLVLNPGFEETARCVEFLGTFNTACTNWSTPSQGSSDLFNSCAKSPVGVPYNFVGIMEPYAGENYAGIYLYSIGDYREYLQGMFSEPLKAGVTYRIRFQMALANTSTMAVKSVGYALHDQKILSYEDEVLSDYVLGRLKLQYTKREVQAHGFYDGKGWRTISDTLTAKGGERFITIGNFLSDRKTKLKKLSDSRKDFAYYYIDMVTVEEIGKELQARIPETLPETTFIAGTTYTLRNVHFEFDSILLDDPARAELDELYLFLTEHPDSTILISGHTDTFGSEAYNLDMSGKRASSVADYLIQSGLNADRVSIFGAGYSQPVDTNETDEGRARNRRVDFILTEIEK